MIRLIKWALLGVLFSQFQFGVALASGYGVIPLYDLPNGKHVLSIGVFEGSYKQGGAHRPGKRISIDVAVPKGSAELIIPLYLEAVADGREADILSFYEKGVNAKAVSGASRFLVEAYGNVKAVSPKKYWLFGDFKVVAFDVVGDDGGRQVLSLGFRRVGDRYFRSDDWGEYKFVRTIFGTMLSNDKKGLTERFGSKRFAHEFLVGEGENSIAFHADGEFFPVSEKWSDIVGVSASRKDRKAFIAYVLGTSNGRSKEEFLELWTTAEAKLQQRRMDRDPDYMKRAGYAYGSSGSIRSLFTLNLGDLYVHYYQDKERPEAVKRLIVKEIDGSYYLTDKLLGNIQVLVSSEVFRKAVRKLWEGQNG